jgi:hypothetical protein
MPADEKTGANKPHRWQPGESGNPDGRPKGSRNRLSELFWVDLHDAWVEKGKSAISRMIEDKPGDFVKVVASQMPKEFLVKGASLEDVSDEELGEIIAALRSFVGAERAAAARGGDAATQGSRKAGSKLQRVLRCSLARHRRLDL